MSRRIARIGSLLLAGFLFGSLVLAFPAAGRQQESPTVKPRDVDPSPGRLKLTIAMSGPAWGGERLDRGDFTATMNGRPVQVAEASLLQEQGGEGGQVAVVLAVDTSGSMLDNNNIGTARSAAANFARQLRSGTRVGVLSFANAPAVEQELTTDPGLAQDAIQALNVDDPQGDTALYDAVVLASRRVEG
jgi:von Willebrand factor type A domain